MINLFKQYGIKSFIISLIIAIIAGVKSLTFALGFTIAFIGYKAIKTKYDNTKKYYYYGTIILGIMMMISAFTPNTKYESIRVNTTNQTVLEQKDNKQNQQKSDNIIEKKEQQVANNVTQSQKFYLTEGQHNEIGESYASVLSNKYEGLFEACNLTYDGKTLLVEVNSHWFNLHKEDKIAFVKDIGSTYSGMMGARGFKLNPEELNILVRHSESGNNLATWDYVFGTKIKK